MHWRQYNSEMIVEHHYDIGSCFSKSSFISYFQNKTSSMTKL